jgi:hypothetical protein
VRRPPLFSLRPLRFLTFSSLAVLPLPHPHSILCLCPFYPALDTDVLSLIITYTPTYPDELPEIGLEVLEGEVNDDEEEFLLNGLRENAEESLGMVRPYSLLSSRSFPPFLRASELEELPLALLSPALPPFLDAQLKGSFFPLLQAMVFTLASQLKELLAEMVVLRKARIAKEDEERYEREEAVCLCLFYSSHLNNTDRLTSLPACLSRRPSPPKSKERRLPKLRSLRGPSSSRLSKQQHGRRKRRSELRRCHQRSGKKRDDGRRS